MMTECVESFNPEDNAQIQSRGITFGCEAEYAISVDEECEDNTIQGFHIINLSHFGFSLLSIFRKIITLRFIRRLTCAKHFTEKPVIELKRVTSSRRLQSCREGRIK